MASSKPRHAFRRWSPLLLILVSLLNLPRVWTAPPSHQAPLSPPSTIDDEHLGPSEAHLQEIASLLDEIYTILANFTFIPHTSIKRGPHAINSTHIKPITRPLPRCKMLDSSGINHPDCTSHIPRDPSVQRLMELMPYVDKLEVDDAHWLFGSKFVDYRQEEELQDEPVDVLHMMPSNLALTKMADGPYVLLHETRTKRIGLLDTKKRVPVNLDEDPLDHKEQLPSFDAPDFLREIVRRYRVLEWIPWETARGGHDDGVPGDKIREFIEKNGWPDHFDADQFNVDMTRFRHNPSNEWSINRLPIHGMAEQAVLRIDELEGRPGETGQIPYTQQELALIREKLNEAGDENETWLLGWELQDAELCLGHYEQDLRSAKWTVQRWCPDSVCVKPDDYILWEYRSLERAEDLARRRLLQECLQLHHDIAAKKGQLCSDDENEANKRRGNVHNWQHKQWEWIKEAAAQARGDAHEHCSKTRPRGSLLPGDTDIDRAWRKRTEAARHIHREKERLKSIEDWLKKVPVSATRAREELEREASRIALGIRWWEDMYRNTVAFIRSERNGLTEAWLAFRGERDEL
ncbi:hypothetical protein BU26DRAFT_521373 [Trematosphaeria pertusa]|uniref:Uncharacterized protein n=1 Tax=Trematosphaeria pertusa TaxID=390896 RepID=A0A6A6I677_9PLEO|nr:uncharacterized protein BU26DRAFT_521373 [Trematosphaeria pertusa]KAF2245816.1 hypothetical protein BU26DRAFT_521373 [Trematosphaeria pertusa]